MAIKQKDDWLRKLVAASSSPVQFLGKGVLSIALAGAGIDTDKVQWLVPASTLGELGLIGLLLWIAGNLAATSAQNTVIKKRRRK